MFRSPNDIIISTNTDSYSTNDESRIALKLEEEGNVLIGSTTGTGADLYINGNLYTTNLNPTEDYHLVTKYYVDNKSVATNNCVWTGYRHNSNDQNTTCRNYGQNYIMSGMDFLKDNDYIRFNAIYCCKVTF